jgi:acetate kinase
VSADGSSIHPGEELRGQPCVVALNCGSSTVKFAVFLRDSNQPALSGNAEALGTPEANLRWSNGGISRRRDLAGADHRQAIEAVSEIIRASGATVVGAGHRVVHGGESFDRPVVVDGEVRREIERLAILAPLHNPANLLGIDLTAATFPDVPQVVVFDTAFHQTLPPRAFHYALPPEFHRKYGVRRYGFHGTSHQYVAQEAAGRLNRKLEELQMITVHLGNGCSACAVRQGRSVDTTMGLTPSEGMMMGTRSGDVDPLLHSFLGRNAGLPPDEITELLIRKSGLLGVSGVSNDLRQIEARAGDGHDASRLALEMFCFRAAKSILGMTASLGRVDALVFTAGIGEHSPAVRREIVAHMPLLGIQLDAGANEKHGTATNALISTGTSPSCLVIPTDEELAIAREVWKRVT